MVYRVQTSEARRLRDTATAEYRDTGSGELMSSAMFNRYIIEFKLPPVLSPTWNGNRVSWARTIVEAPPDTRKLSMKTQRAAIKGKRIWFDLKKLNRSPSAEPREYDNPLVLLGGLQLHATPSVNRPGPPLFIIQHFYLPCSQRYR